MASITFNSLKNKAKSEENHTYVDFYLDLEENVLGSQSTITQTTGNGRDIRVAIDLNAIRNSLRNLFNTNPGERPLLPQYGADLRRLIFEPISETTGNRIGRLIRYSLASWEPRVQLRRLDIVGVRDRHEYQITMVLGIPFLTEPLNVSTIFTREGFVINAG